MITSVAVVRAYADERRYHATNYICMLVTGGGNIVRIELSGASSVWVSKTNSGATLREMLAYSSRTRVTCVGGMGFCQRWLRRYWRASRQRATASRQQKEEKKTARRNVTREQACVFLLVYAAV